MAPNKAILAGATNSNFSNIKPILSTTSISHKDFLYKCPIIHYHFFQKRKIKIFLLPIHIYYSPIFSLSFRSTPYLRNSRIGSPKKKKKLVVRKKHNIIHVLFRLLQRRSYGFSSQALGRNACRSTTRNRPRQTAQV
jgi:hypothetical protein